MNPLAMLKLFSPVEWGVAALGIAAVFAGHLVDVHNHEVRAERRGRAAVQALWDAQKVVDQAAALKAQAEAREKDAQWAKAKQETDDEAQRMAARRMAAAAGLADAAAGLRERAAAALAAPGDRAAAHPEAAAGREAADETARVCSELLAAADQRLRILAGFADAAADAGAACQRQYESVTSEGLIEP